MGNMSYCRFRNTIRDLQDCYNHLGDDLSDKEEMSAKERLIELCKMIAEEYED